MLEEELDAVLGEPCAAWPMPSMKRAHDSRVRRLERVVVALDPRPDDQVRADLAGEVGGVERELQRLVAHRVVGRGEAAPPEARVEVQPAREAVDAVAVERLAHLLEVVAVELVRVVELVVVHQVAEAVDRAAHLLGRRLVGELRLVAAGDEARDHPAERPDPSEVFKRSGMGRSFRRGVERGDRAGLTQGVVAAEERSPLATDGRLEVGQLERVGVGGVRSRSRSIERSARRSSITGRGHARGRRGTASPRCPPRPGGAAAVGEPAVEVGEHVAGEAQRGGQGDVDARPPTTCSA